MNFSEELGAPLEARVPVALPPLQQCCLAEAIGTFILVFFGCGAVHTAILFEAQSGLWQIAIVWGLAIMLAIFIFGSISGAHINPAITVAMWLWKGFLPARVLPYIVAQMLGAFLAAAMLYLLFAPQLSALEERLGIQRGQPGSEITASCYGEFYPPPGALIAAGAYDSQAHAEMRARVPHAIAFMAELLGTAVLALMVFGLTDDANRTAPPMKHAPIFIGLTVSMLISVLAPLTQAGFNPARDFAPRVFAYLAGWGTIAWPMAADWSWLTVYILAPVLGAALGGGFYQLVLQPLHSSGR